MMGKATRGGRKRIALSNDMVTHKTYVQKRGDIQISIAKIAAACFYHIRRLRQVRRRIGQEVTQQLVLALIMSRLDYCNSALAGLPTSTLQPLHRVQNAAALLVFGLSSFDHVTPTLIQLHWLQNKVQTVLSRPRHPLRSQPVVSDGNGPVSRRRQITFRTTLIFHLIDGLFSTTAAHEVQRAGVLTCGSRHLERSARPHPHRG